MKLVMRRAIAILAGLVSLVLIGYGVALQTSAGRAICGISSVCVVNESATALEGISVYLTDSRGRQIDRHFRDLKPRGRIRVDIHTSDLIVRQIVCRHRERSITFDGDANVTPGEVFVVTFDSQGVRGIGHANSSKGWNLSL
jgi:hypothetical protein